MAFNDGGDAYGGSAADALYERVVPSGEMVNKLLAITTAAASEGHGAIRDASVRGYMYVAEVDEQKKRVKLLSPQPGQVPGPEDVASLVG
jgi:polyribonucleotide 5'-hydroxyl-kinase